MPLGLETKLLHRIYTSIYDLGFWQHVHDHWVRFLERLRATLQSRWFLCAASMRSSPLSAPNSNCTGPGKSSRTACQDRVEKDADEFISSCATCPMRLRLVSVQVEHPDRQGRQNNMAYTHCLDCPKSLGSCLIDNFDCKTRLGTATYLGTVTKL